jgi:hypothetical protein
MSTPWREIAPRINFDNIPKIDLTQLVGWPGQPATLNGIQVSVETIPVYSDDPAIQAIIQRGVEIQSYFATWLASQNLAPAFYGVVVETGYYLIVREYVAGGKAIVSPIGGVELEVANLPLVQQSAIDNVQNLLNFLQGRAGEDISLIVTPTRVLVKNLDFYFFDAPALAGYYRDGLTALISRLQANLTT